MFFEVLCIIRDQGFFSFSLKCIEEKTVNFSSSIRSVEMVFLWIQFNSRTICLVKYVHAIYRKKLILKNFRTTKTFLLTMVFLPSLESPRFFQFLFSSFKPQIFNFFNDRAIMRGRGGGKGPAIKDFFWFFLPL